MRSTKKKWPVCSKQRGVESRTHNRFKNRGQRDKGRVRNGLKKITKRERQEVEGGRVVERGGEKR